MKNHVIKIDVLKRTLDVYAVFDVKIRKKNHLKTAN